MKIIHLYTCTFYIISIFTYIEIYLSVQYVHLSVCLSVCVSLSDCFSQYLDNQIPFSSLTFSLNYFSQLHHYSLYGKYKLPEFEAY